METGIGLLIVLLVLYFLPWLCAASRGHHNSGAIFVLNLFLGWTVLGWIVSLVWAFTAIQRPVERHQATIQSGQAVTPARPSLAAGVPQTQASSTVLGVIAIIIGITIGLAVLTMFSRPSPAAPATHNGSLVDLIQTPEGYLDIVYLQPRASLPVAPGVLLFRGKWYGKPPGVMAGIAFVFPGYPCTQPVPYKVQGTVDQSNALMLFGPAPIVSATCNVLGSDWTGNSVLRFEPQGGVVGKR